jgi:hypothetical protein
VYSFAITLYEMLTLKRLYHPIEKAAEFVENLRNGLRPNLEDSNLQQFEAQYPICNLINNCWQALPEARPSFLDINTYLNPK